MIKMKGMAFRYMWVYSKEDTMAHTLLQSPGPSTLSVQGPGLIPLSVWDMFKLVHLGPHLQASYPPPKIYLNSLTMKHRLLASEWLTFK